MSTAQSRAAQLRLEEQLRQCLDRISELERRVAVLEAEKESSAFDLVSDIASSVLPPSQTDRPTSARPSHHLEEQIRSEVLLQIGSWIRACLEGRRRGLSGRERLSEGNSCYLVFRGFSGQVYDPVGVFERFSDLVPEVKPHGHPGNSIFIGLPTLDDARLVAAAAGVQWPH